MKTKRKTSTKVKGTKSASKPKGSKAKKKKMIATAFAASVAGIIGYFSWQYLKKTKRTRTNEDIDAVLKQSTSIIEPSAITMPSITSKPKTTKTIASYSISQPISNDSFPLKKGSKGELVKQLQEALIAKYGVSILPKYGADGDFGSETVNALKKLGYPASIDESTFNVINAATKTDAVTVGKEIYSAANTKNYSSTLNSLKKLKSAEDYSKANEVFKSNRIGGVHKTIVNALLDTFSTTSQKDAIKQEFLRMGLQFDGRKWSLSGLDGVSIITIEPTTIWVNAKETVKVPARMVLGAEVSRRLDYTLFENRGKYFLVNTKSVQYL